MAVLLDVDESYHEWLCNLMRIDLPEHSNFEKLLYDLDERAFTWCDPMDENRDIDAWYLRKEYYRDDVVSGDLSSVSPRSCLEVLVAFSRRLEIEYTGEPGDDHIERWFWIMLDNLGLLEFDDDNYDRAFIQHILNVWLTKNYTSGRYGNLFPVKKRQIDLQKTDMWYQAQLYISENWRF